MSEKMKDWAEGGRARPESYLTKVRNSAVLNTLMREENFSALGVCAPSLRRSGQRRMICVNSNFVD